MKKVSSLVKTGCVFGIINLILGAFGFVISVAAVSWLTSNFMEDETFKNLLPPMSRYILEYPILSACVITIISLLFIYFYIMIFQGQISNQNRILLGILGIIIGFFIGNWVFNLLGCLFIVFGKYEDSEL